MWAQAYGSHPYARPADGMASEAEKITADIANAFHSRFYVPNNAAIIAVGDIDAQTFVAQVRAAFGRRRPAAAAALVPMWAYTEL